MVETCLSRLNNFEDKAQFNWKFQETKNVMLNEPNYELLDGLDGCDYKTYFSPFTVAFALEFNAMRRVVIEPEDFAKQMLEERMKKYEELYKKDHTPFETLMINTIIDKHIPLYLHPTFKFQKCDEFTTLVLGPDVNPEQVQVVSQWNLMDYSGYAYCALNNDANQSKTVGVALDKIFDKYDIRHTTNSNFNTTPPNIFVKCFGARCSNRSLGALVLDWCLSGYRTSKKGNDASKKRKEKCKKYEKENLKFITSIIKCHQLGNYLHAKTKPDFKRRKRLWEKYEDLPKLLTDTLEIKNYINSMVRECIAMLTENNLILSEMASTESPCTKVYQRQALEVAEKIRIVSKKEKIKYLQVIYNTPVKMRETAVHKNYFEWLLSLVLQRVDKTMKDRLCFCEKVIPIDAIRNFSTKCAVSERQGRPIPWELLKVTSFSDKTISVLKNTEILFGESIDKKCILLESLSDSELRDLFIIVYLVLDDDKIRYVNLPEHFYIKQMAVACKKEEGVEDPKNKREFVTYCPKCKTVKTHKIEGSSVHDLGRKSKSSARLKNNKKITGTDAVASEKCDFTCIHKLVQKPAKFEYCKPPPYDELPQRIKDLLALNSLEMFKAVKREKFQVFIGTKYITEQANSDTTESKKRKHAMICEQLSTALLDPIVGPGSDETRLIKIPKEGLLLITKDKKYTTCFGCGCGLAEFALNFFLGENFYCIPCYEQLTKERIAAEKRCFYCQAKNENNKSLQLLDKKIWVCVGCMPKQTEEWLLGLVSEKDFISLVRAENEKYHLKTKKDSAFREGCTAAAFVSNEESRFGFLKSVARKKTICKRHKH
jgi:hypothetical protein